MVNVFKVNLIESKNEQCMNVCRCPASRSRAA